MPNVASATKYFPTAREGFTTTLASTIASGAVTVPLNSVAGFTNGATVVLVIEPTSATQKQAFTGVVDTAGVQITNVVWTEGTNSTHTAGVTVVDYETATHWALYSKGLLVEHNQDGTHSDVTATSVDTDTLIVNTGTTLPAGDIVTADIANAAVTADKLAVGGATAVVATSQTTTSTSFTDLATAGPAVTVDIGQNGLALVSINAQMFSNGANNVYMGFAISGASTVAASDAQSLAWGSTVLFKSGITFLVTGLTPGSTTFTTKYRTTGGTATYSARNITVIPL